jgi:hypothetical protein
MLAALRKQGVVPEVCLPVVRFMQERLTNEVFAKAAQDGMRLVHLDGHEPGLLYPGQQVVDLPTPVAICFPLAGAFANWTRARGRLAEAN